MNDWQKVDCTCASYSGFSVLYHQNHCARRQAWAQQPKQVRDQRNEEANRVAACLTGKSLQEIVYFAKEYAKGKDWHKMVSPGWKAILKPRKYTPGQLVFDVYEGKTPYIYVASMSRPGSSAYIVLDFQGKVHRPRNIQFPEERRGISTNDDFRRAIWKAAVEGQLSQ